MATLSLGQKAHRVLAFLLGMRNARIAGVLEERGLTKQVLDDGWARLRAVTKVRMNLPAPATRESPALLELDAWENEWLPIADATLAHNYPAVRDRVFLNLSQTEGAAVIVSVETFLERVAELEAPNGPHGADGPGARALLKERGLTPGVVAVAQAILDKLGTIETLELPPDEQQQKEEIAKAEAALWSWYLEWSTIARIAIQDRRLLRALGFLRPSSSAREEELEAATDDVVPGVV